MRPKQKDIAGAARISPTIAAGLRQRRDQPDHRDLEPGRQDQYLLKASPVEWQGIDAPCPLSESAPQPFN
jgi:hypothetical protein